MRRQAGRLKDAKAAQRLLAIALVLEGSSRTQAAEACGMDPIVEACCKAWNFFANDPATVTSITARDWAQVNQ